MDVIKDISVIDCVFCYTNIIKILNLSKLNTKIFMDLFHFDIETCGQYKDFKSFKNNDKKGSDLFESKYERMNWSDKYESVDDAYLENSGIISTFGKICCISFGYIDSENKKQIRSFYGDDEKNIVSSYRLYHYWSNRDFTNI